MKDMHTLIVVVLISMLAVGAIAFDMTMVYRKNKEKREHEDAVSRVMRKYRTITLGRPLAAIAVGRLANREMRDIAFEIYSSEVDPDSFFFITRRKNDEPVMKPSNRFLVVATSENYSEVVAMLAAR